MTTRPQGPCALALLSRSGRTAALMAAVLAAGSSARAVDFLGVQSGALDQPQINTIVYLGSNTAPQVNPTAIEVINDDLTSTYLPGFTFTAFLDTGASGILLSGNYDNTGTPVSGVAAGFNIPLQPSPTTAGEFVKYADVGVGGSDNFWVSDKLRIAVASYVSGRTDLDQFTTGGVPITTPYTPILANAQVRVQVGPQRPIVHDELEQLIQELGNGDINVVGMPAMTGKVVVIDPKRVNNFGKALDIINGLSDPTNLDVELPDISMRTWIYTKGTAFNPAYNTIPESDTTTEPGIPTTSHHVRMTYASFDKFTSLTPGTSTGAEMPVLHRNPFIGKNPVDGSGSAPGVLLTRAFDDAQGVHHNARVEASMLLDTGAGASMISKRLAGELGVSIAYELVSANDPLDPDAMKSVPYLVDASGERIGRQFRLSINGIGSDPNNPTTLAGFYLDALTLRTIEGNAADDNDPNHLRFLEAPVLVGDISLKDPTSDPLNPTILTLDGILGMNFLSASMALDDNLDISELLGLDVSAGPFNWITVDFSSDNEAILGLDVAAVPEPASLGLLALGAVALLRRRK